MSDPKPIRLADELNLYGSDWDAGEFENLIMELHAVMHPAWNVDTLMHNPKSSGPYCDTVRAGPAAACPTR